MGGRVRKLTLRNRSPHPTGLCMEQLRNQQSHIKYIYMYTPSVHNNYCINVPVGVGPENRFFLGPEMATSEASAIWAQQSQDLLTS